MEHVVFLGIANGVLIVPIYFVLSHLSAEVNALRKEVMQNGIDIGFVKGRLTKSHTKD